jgi:hypothetical protein
MALLAGGRLHSISLFRNSEGLARTSSRFWLGRILVAYAGYTGSSLAAIGLTCLIRDGRYSLIWYILLAIFICSILLWVRNLYGMLWLITVSGGMMVVSDYAAPSLMVQLIWFLWAVLVVQSVSTSFIILKLSLLNGNNAGDATRLAEETFIPALMWGLLFAAQSVYAVYYIFHDVLATP